MAKKTAKKSKKSNLNLLWLIIGVITVLYLMAQLQEKEKEIKDLKKNKDTGISQEEKSGGSPQRDLPRKKIVLTKEQETVARNQIHEHLDKIIQKKPAMSGKWVLSDVKFNDNGTVTLLYEDGVNADEITLKHSDPSDYRTWQKIGGK